MKPLRFGALVGRELRNVRVQLTRKQVREITDWLKGLKTARSKKRLREPVNAKRALDKERAGVSEQDLRRLTR